MPCANAFCLQKGHSAPGAWLIHYTALQTWLGTCIFCEHFSIARVSLSNSGLTAAPHETAGGTQDHDLADRNQQNRPPHERLMQWVWSHFTHGSGFDGQDGAGAGQDGACNGTARQSSSAAPKQSDDSNSSTSSSKRGQQQQHAPAATAVFKSSKLAFKSCHCWCTSVALILIDLWLSDHGTECSHPASLPLQYSVTFKTNVGWKTACWGITACSGFCIVAECCSCPEHAQPRCLLLELKKSCTVPQPPSSFMNVASHTCPVCPVLTPVELQVTHHCISSMKAIPAQL